MCLKRAETKTNITLTTQLLSKLYITKSSIWPLESSGGEGLDELSLSLNENITLVWHMKARLQPKGVVMWGTEERRVTGGQVEWISPLFEYITALHLEKNLICNKGLILPNLMMQSFVDGHNSNLEIRIRYKITSSKSFIHVKIGWELNK